MAGPPRLELALLPTPILKLERLSRDLGVDLYVKRDDLTGLLESGNSVRKLEFLAGEAVAQGADTLITWGSPESHGCRAAAAVASRLGLSAIVAVPGDRPVHFDGSLLLERLLGAQVRYLAGNESDRAGEVVDRIAGEVRQAGRRPYVIPESGANEVGALGYLECAAELGGQISHGAPAFDTVVVTSFTGTGQAGLLMGKQLAGLPSEIVGIPVGARADSVRAGIRGIIQGAIQRFGFAIDVPKSIHLLEGHAPGSRTKADDADLRVVASVARREGLVLDPVYTARAFGVLMDVLGRDPKALGQRVCFIHTGGAFGVFPCRDRLSRLLDGVDAPRD